MQRSVTIDLSRYQAVILDMDGVITRTAAIHAQAWKRMFDGFLKDHALETGTPFRPFDAHADYRSYVDGKPRLEGLRSFLQARGIELPAGDPSDPPSAATVQGLGGLKNQLFHDLVEERGVEVFPSSVLLTGLARIAGLRTGVVTSSRNGRFIMERAGLLDLFDVLVDGNVSAERGLEGKPKPDIMLETARRLQVEPDEAVLFEDAISGVQSGRAAGMGLTIGVARSANEAALQRAGADRVIEDLAQVKLLSAGPRPAPALPTVSACRETLAVMAASTRRTAVFLDYDGTLTPIVARPDLARLSDEMRATVSALAQTGLVAIISGRDLQDVRSLVGLNDIYYAGSHGFDLAGPGGMRLPLEKGTDLLPLLEEAEEELHSRLDRLQGVLFERKRFSLAIHFRLAAPEAEETVNEAVRDAVGRRPGLRAAGGKKVAEVQPDIDWDKGKAVDWLLEQLRIDPSESLVLYLGDDLTDEDAFRALKGRGVGILVREDLSRDTHADLGLADTAEVREFLEALRTSTAGRGGDE